MVVNANTYPEYNCEGDGLFDLLIMASEDTLDERLLDIMDRRYGFSGNDPQTLAAIGEDYGVTRERIRQLLNKALRRIGSRGTRQINRGMLTEPAAQLIKSIRSSVNPEKDDHIDRLIALAEAELGHLDNERQGVGLLAYFLGGQNAVRKYRHLVANRLPAYYRLQRHPIYLKAQADQLNNILEDVIWPKTLINNIRKKQVYSRKREVSAFSKGDSGSFFSEKLQRDVFFESTLERDFLQKLEWLEWIVFYQEQPLRISYLTGTQKRLYFPDVFFELQDGRCVVVEIKPRNGMAVHANWQKWAALRNYCQAQDFGFLITNGRYSLQDIGRKNVRQQVKEVILDALNNGPIDWGHYKVLREKCQITTTELYALIIQERLQWQPRPFSLEKSKTP